MAVNHGGRGLGWLRSAHADRFAAHLASWSGSLPVKHARPETHDIWLGCSAHELARKRQLQLALRRDREDGGPPRGPGSLGRDLEMCRQSRPCGALVAGGVVSVAISTPNCAPTSRPRTTRRDRRARARGKRNAMQRRFCRAACVTAGPGASRFILFSAADLFASVRTRASLLQADPVDARSRLRAAAGGGWAPCRSEVAFQRSVPAGAAGQPRPKAVLATANWTGKAPCPAGGRWTAQCWGRTESSEADEVADEALRGSVPAVFRRPLVSVPSTTSLSGPPFASSG